MLAVEGRDAKRVFTKYTEPSGPCPARGEANRPWKGRRAGGEHELIESVTGEVRAFSAR